MGIGKINGDARGFARVHNSGFAKHGSGTGAF
jgi:hypothetical protein